MRAPDLQIHLASYLKHHLGSFEKRYQEHMALHFVIQAHARLQIDDQHYDLQGSWLWAGYPGPYVRQEAGSPLPKGHYRLAMSGKFVEDLLHDDVLPMRPLQIYNTNALSTCFESLFAALRGNTALHRRQQANALEACLIEAWSQQEQVPGQALWLQKCCQYLEDHACVKFSYQHLAKTIAIPLPTLRRHFTKAMGMPMHQYVMQHRCALAQTALIETDHSVAEIAEDLCYDDVAYFSKQFKRLTGLSPSAFRQQRYY